MHSVSNMIKCSKCNHTGKPIVKMGGIVCENCRVIVYPAYSNEWYKIKKQLRCGSCGNTGTHTKDNTGC